MGTRYLLEKAARISQNMTASDKSRVRSLCNEIRKSQKELLAAGDTAMRYCTEKCKGMCCRNLDIDSIFSLWDFIFILMLQPHLRDDMQERLDAHLSLYLSPCPFLRDSQGPCIFPDHMKAQICVVTFCATSQEIKKPMRKVNFNFYKLSWLIQYLRIKRIFLKITAFFSGHTNTDSQLT